MKLSVVVPAKNEESVIEKTVRYIYAALKAEKIPHEIIVVDDHSMDRTWWILMSLRKELPTLHPIKNELSPGFGLAVQIGLERMRGDVVCVMMADGSDDPDDLVVYYRKLVESGVDCVFGSRFIRGSKVHNYPVIKLVLNRLTNWCIKILFSIRYNDVTNAFKMFRRDVIAGLTPLLSRHFNLTVELPLKAIVRGYSFEVVPISWRQRKMGISKLKLQEMGSRYMFIILYCFLEKWLSRGDYRRPATSDRSQANAAKEYKRA